jgi:hypothetical protein
VPKRRRRPSKLASYLRAIREMTGATQYEARLVWQRLAGWLDYHDRISVAAIERHPKKVAEYLSLARGFVPPGWVVEVTLRTKGGVYRRDGKRVKDRRPLYVKIVVTAREALPIAEHERAVRLTLRAGAVPPGFKIKYADWEKGRGYGRITRAADLIAFYGAVRHPNTQIRADMVAREEEL